MTNPNVATRTVPLTTLLEYINEGTHFGYEPGMYPNGADFDLYVNALDGLPQPGYYYKGDLNVMVTRTEPEWDALFGEFERDLIGLGDEPPTTWKGVTVWWLTRLGYPLEGITHHAL